MLRWRVSDVVLPRWGLARASRDLYDFLAFTTAGVAKLAYAADSKSLADGDSTTSKTYRNLSKISFKPMTGADFSPMFRRKLGES
jgi:hypothetical protein